MVGIDPRPVAASAERLRDLLETLFPLHRTHAGPGLRATLAHIGSIIPLEVHEVPSGTRVFDWVVPQEWRVREAWVADSSGHRVIDYASSNLHIVGHSLPIDARLTRDELLEHIHTRPDRPDVIPYRTAPYREEWGFCARHSLLDELTDDAYDVRIDADRFDGSMSYGEAVFPGATANEIVITTHACHPSLASDNTSGLAVTTLLAAAVASRPRRRHTFRFLFVPGTIGSIAWLAANRDRLGAIRHGIVVAGVGDPGRHTYQQTFAGDAVVDRAMALALRDRDEPHRIQPFTPWGYDERQFNSPGFRLPFGRLSRTPHQSYPEYHTSADDLDFVQDESLVGTLGLLADVVDILETDRPLHSTSPYGEPRLSDRGLMSPVGGRTAVTAEEHVRLWVMAMADGLHGPLDIAERSGLPFASVAAATAELEGVGLLAPGDDEG